MKTTGNLGLKKPEGTDLVDIADLNGNMDILDLAVTGKVDKVTGKQLSTNDYTAAEKTKLAGIATGATNYTHPTTHPPAIIAQDASNRFVTDAEKNTWNNKASTAEATLNTPGLMPQAAFEKLVDIEEGANRYIHPSTHPATMITEDTTHRFATDIEKAKWNNALPTTGGVITGDVAIDPAGSVSNSWSRVLRFRFRDALNTIRERVLSVNPFGKLIFNANSQDYEIPVATTADITYYVRTDGNDSNTGLTDTAGGAFKTVGKAISMLPKLGDHNRKVNVGAGAYTEDVIITGFSGNGRLDIVGDTVVSATRTITSLVVTNNTAPIYIKGVRALNTVGAGFYGASNTNFGLEACSIISSAPTQPGFDFGGGGMVSLNGCLASNRNAALNVNGAVIVVSYTWQTGSGNSYGISVYFGKVGKVGTQPTGTTAEYVAAGGEISTQGVINPWGDNTPTGRTGIFAGKGAAQSVPSGVWTKVAFAGTSYDHLNEFNKATSTFIAKQKGMYLVNASVFFDSVPAGFSAQLRLYLNYSTNMVLADTIAVSATSLLVKGSVAMYMDAGHTLELYTYISGQATTINLANDVTAFQINRIA